MSALFKNDRFKDISDLGIAFGHLGARKRGNIPPLALGMIYRSCLLIGNGQLLTICQIDALLVLFTHVNRLEAILQEIDGSDALDCGVRS